MSDQPLPCPFCGKIPIIEPWHGGAKTKRRVGCDPNECDVAPAVAGSTRKRAVARWNKRAPLAKDDSDVE